MPRKTMTDMEKVLEVLTNSAEYPAPAPASARAMLAGGLPHSLAAAGAEAHGYQQEIAGLVASMLEEVRTAAEGVLAKAGSVSEEAEAQRAAADAELAAAAEKSDGAKAEAESKEAALKEAKAAVKSDQALHKEAKEAEAAVLQEKKLLTAKKAQLDGLAAALKTFEEGQGEVQAPVDDVLAYLEEINAEKALIAALPGALERKPAERGAFDTITLAELDDLLSQSVTSVAAELAESEQTERQVSAEALGAWAVLDISQERSVEAAAAVCAAQEALEAAVAEQEAAEAAVTQRNAAVTDALVQKTLAEEKVREAAEAEGALERLRNPPPPAVEEPAAQAEAEAVPMDVSESNAAMDVSEDKAAMDVVQQKMPEAEAALDISRIPTPMHA